MRSRRYTDRINIFQTRPVPDGAGGNTVSSELLGSSWCEVKTLRAERTTELGLNENSVVVEINLRHREDITYSLKNMYLQYKGKYFNILRIEPVNMESYEVKILASSKDLNNA